MKKIAAMFLMASLLVPAAAQANTLSWSYARGYAKQRAWSLPIRGQRVSIDWCNRWSAHVVHCGVTESRKVRHYDSYLDYSYTTTSECSGTVYVKASHRTGRVRTSLHDTSCFYG